MPRKPSEFVGHPWEFPGGIYRAYCHHVVDGDTFDALVDLGLFQYAYQPFRLKDYNAYEINKLAERPQGLLDQLALTRLIAHKPIEIRTFKDAMSFDRFIATVFVKVDGNLVDVVQYLRDAGYGKH